MANICPDCAAAGEAMRKIREMGGPGVPNSQTALAAAMGMGRVMLTLREGGKRHWRLCEIVAAAKALKVEVTDLVPEVGTPAVTPEEVLYVVKILTKVARQSV